MSKREHEAEFFERFKATRPDLNVAGARHDDVPDFIVSRPEGTLGVEVTRFTPLPTQSGFIAEEQDALRNRLLGRLRDQYYSLDGPPLHVQALFNDRHPLRAHRIEEIVSKIASILLTRTPFIELHRPVPWERWELQLDVPEVVSLSAVRVRTRGHGAWYAAKAGWMRIAQLEDFEPTLAAKAARLPAYRARADEVWLLIAFEMLPGGLHLKLPREPSFKINTDFDRVFALDALTDTCVELPKTRADL